MLTRPADADCPWRLACQTPRLVAIAGSAFLLAACEGSTGAGVAGSEPHVVRDSAGVQIVESIGPAWGEGEGWSVSADPMLRLGSVEGDPLREFSRIQGLVRLSDGRIAVLDAQARELRIFGPEGAHLLTLGGPGEGPGELSAPRGLELLPGGILQVVDRLDRVRYSTDGALVSDERLDFNRVLDVGSYVTECGALPLFHGDHILLCPRRNEADLPQEGLHRPLNAIVRFPWDLSSADTLGTLLGLEQYALQAGGRRQFVIHPLYSRGVAALDGERMYLAETGRYEIEMWSLRGGLERVIRRPGTASPPSPEAIESGYETAAGTLLTDRGNTALVRGRIHVPDSVAPLGGINVDAEGHLWVRTAGPPEGGSWFDVFDPEGRLLGAVAVPAGIQLFDIGRDYLLGVRFDELRVPFVELYALRRR